MSLVEAVAASLLLLLGSSAAAQLWSQGLRASWEQRQRESQLHSLDALVLASEGKARALAASQGPAAECQAAVAQLVPMLRALPSELEQGREPQASLSLPESGAGLLHVRWAIGALQRQRLLSVTALGLCR
jgi:hypothetical protein